MDITEYDLDRLVHDIVDIFDIFLTNIFFLSEEQSEELERFLFAIASIIVEIWEHFTGIENGDSYRNYASFLNLSDLLDPFSNHNLYNDNNLKTFHINSLSDVLNYANAVEANATILDKLVNIPGILENVYSVTKTYLPIMGQFSETTSDYVHKDLASILQCWKSINDVYQDPTCLISHNEDLKKAVRYLKSIEDDYELVSTTINSTYLSRDFFYNRVALQHLVAIPLTDLLETSSGNKTDIIKRMEDDLVVLGNLKNSSAHSLLKSYIDVNRLNFFNFFIPEEVRNAIHYNKAHTI